MRHSLRWRTIVWTDERIVDIPTNQQIQSACNSKQSKPRSQELNMFKAQCDSLIFKNKVDFHSCHSRFWVTCCLWLWGMWFWLDGSKITYICTYTFIYIQICVYLFVNSSKSLKLHICPLQHWRQHPYNGWGHGWLTPCQHFCLYNFNTCANILGAKQEFSFWVQSKTFFETI